MPGHVPERHLDRADGATPRLEAAALADLAHDALDVGRVFADERWLQMQDVPGQVRLVRLDLAVAVDPLVGDDAHDRVLADHRALEIDDLHREAAPVIMPSSGRADWSNPSAAATPCPRTASYRSVRRMA